MDTTFIPFHQPSIGSEKVAAVEEVLASEWLTPGPATFKSNVNSPIPARDGCGGVISPASKAVRQVLRANPSFRSTAASQTCQKH